VKPASGCTIEQRKRLREAKSAFKDVTDLKKSAELLNETADAVTQLLDGKAAAKKTFNAAVKKAPDGNIPDSPIDGGECCALFARFTRHPGLPIPLPASSLSLSFAHSHFFLLSLFFALSLSLYLSLSPFFSLSLSLSLFFFSLSLDRAHDRRAEQHDLESPRCRGPQRKLDSI
jgi:hypothetical protein